MGQIKSNTLDAHEHSYKTYLNIKEKIKTHKQKEYLLLDTKFQNITVQFF